MVTNTGGTVAGGGGVGDPAAPPHRAAVPPDHLTPGPELQTEVSHGVRWGLIASVVTQVGRLAFVALLMRLLGPENFGIVAQALVYVAVTYIFLHLGTAANIIRRPVLTRAEIGSAWWINVALGSALAGLTLVAAPALAGFFHTEELAAVLRVLSICLVLKAVAVVPTALLYRNMRFRALGMAEVASTLFGGAVAVAAAVNGAGYWALVVQVVATDATYFAALVWTGGRPETAWSTTAARQLWSFSSRVMAAELVKYVSENADKLLVARFLGATSLGFYSLAYRVLLLPLLMMQQAGRVILPTFSRLQDDRRRLGHVFLRATEGVALIVCPAMTLTVVCAPVAVPTVLGEAWAPAVVPLQLLAVMTMQYLIMAIVTPVLLAVGRADWELRWSVFAMVVHLGAFTVGLHGGITGVATAYLLAGFALAPLRFVVVQQVIPVSARAYMRALVPPVGSAAVLWGAWSAASAALRGTAGGMPRIACASVVGLAAYAAAARLLWPRDVRVQLEFARLVIRGGGT